MAPDTVIHTLRHAQTTYGAEQRYAGSLDAPLNEKGVSDCARAASVMTGVRIDVVVTSTMVRAIETARLLGYEPARCIQTSLCNERSYGILEGRTWQEVPSIEPPVLFIEVGGDVHSVNPAGGEPFEDVWQRAKEFRGFMMDRCEGRSALVVSHAVFLQMFHGVLRGSNCIESLACYPGNLELFTFRLSDGGLVDESSTRLLVADEEGF